VSDPAAVYEERLQSYRTAHARLEWLDVRFAYGRLSVFGLAVVAALAAWRGFVTTWALAAPAVAFLLLVVRHDRVLRRREAAARAIAYYERGLARIDDRWMGKGEPGTRFADEHHPYANDLDLFGPASLFQLLSTARTRDGEDLLARWLLAAAAPAVIRERQEAAAALAPDVALRERVAISGESPHIAVETSALRRWAGEAAPPDLGRVGRITYAFVFAAFAAAAVLATTGTLRPLTFVLVAQLIARQVTGGRIERILQVAGGKARDLATLRELLRTLEFLHPTAHTSPGGSGAAALSATRLAALRTAVAGEGGSASRAIHSLQQIAERHDWGHSLPLIPLGAFLYYAMNGPEWALHLALVSASALLLLNPLLALAVERWRDRHGRHVGGWISALAEFEALIALATYHYEHPHDPFPEIDGDGPRTAARFEGVALGHPLLPAGRTVRNDVALTAGTQLLVVSGSNMSGKSTLLRTVGINAVLALAGAPVRAASLRISPLAIGATLRIQDSLQEGRSRFFAEITRIRELADLANGDPPLLFLLDELLHGTNSHDRLVGAAGILRTLLERGAIGLITTHDLALTAIADELGPRAANIHFEDVFEGGEIRFDYRVKPGPVTRSNALALMRAVGLEVDPEA
jgi:hypothetical protein